MDSAVKETALPLLLRLPKWKRQMLETSSPAQPMWVPTPSAIPAVAKKPSSSDESSWSSWSESPTTRSGAPRPKDNREKAKDVSVDETHSAVSTIMPSTSSSQPNDPASETPDPSKPPTLFSDFDGDSDADCHVTPAPSANEESQNTKEAASLQNSPILAAGNESSLIKVAKQIPSTAKHPR